MKLFLEKSKCGSQVDLQVDDPLSTCFKSFLSATHYALDIELVAEFKDEEPLPGQLPLVRNGENLQKFPGILLKAANTEEEELGNDQNFECKNFRF